MTDVFKDRIIIKNELGGTYQKIKPKEYKYSKLITFFEPSLPSSLEKALKEAKYGDSYHLDRYRDSTIQQIINGGFEWQSPPGRKILTTLGISINEANELRKQALDFSKKVDPGELNPVKVVSNLSKLFEHLDIDKTMKDGKLVVYSFGCGKGLEAKACLNYFSDSLDRFIGYDINGDGLRLTRFLNQDPKVSFEEKDLFKGLPEGTPDLIIIRHPTIYLHNQEGQTTPNSVWHSILNNIRATYPNSSILITTLTRKEAILASQWIGGSEKDFVENPFPTHLQAKFGRFGTFNLPFAADAYYIHLKQ